MLHLVKTIEVEDFNVQSKEGNHLFIDGYVGCYSDHEGCTSMEHIKGMIEVSVEGDKITHIYQMMNNNVERILFFKAKKHRGRKVHSVFLSEGMRGDRKKGSHPSC